MWKENRNPFLQPISRFSKDGENLNFSNARFVTTAVSADIDLPLLPCVIMAGRSNSGKSSLINMLTNKKSLARVGQSPGKTTNINIYNVDDSVLFCDLPGYGYAKRSFGERDRWAALISDFLASMGSKGVPVMGILVVDSRIEVLESDAVMADYFRSFHIEYLTAMNKSEKLKSGAAEKAFQTFGKVFTRPVFTSGVTGKGCDTVRAMIEDFASGIKYII